MVDRKGRLAMRFIDWITRPMETGEIGFSPSGIALRGMVFMSLLVHKVKWLK